MEEEQITLKQKEKRRMKEQKEQKLNHPKNLENNRKNIIKDKAKLQSKIAVKNVQNNTNYRHDASSIFANKSKEAQPEKKPANNVQHRSRRILKSSFNTQIVNIRRNQPKDDKMDKSFAIVNLQNAGVNALQKLGGAFEHSDSDFFGISEHEDHELPGSSGKKRFGAVFDRNNDSARASERKRIDSNDMPIPGRISNSGEVKNRQFGNLGSLRKHFDTPNRLSSTKKRKTDKKFIDVQSEDENVFLTLDDWNANIIAYNTPYKEEDFSKKISNSTYRRQLNFEPLVATGIPTGQEASIPINPNQIKRPNDNHNNSQIINEQKLDIDWTQEKIDNLMNSSQNKFSNSLVFRDNVLNKDISGGKAPLFNPVNVTLDFDNNNTSTKNSKQNSNIKRTYTNDDLEKQNLRAKKLRNSVLGH